MVHDNRYMMHATTIRRWKKERVGRLYIKEMERDGRKAVQWGRRKERVGRLYIKKMEREGRKAVHKGAGKRGWEGCPMKETEGESGKAVQWRRRKERVGRLSNEEDGRREGGGCTWRRWKERVGRLYIKEMERECRKAVQWRKRKKREERLNMKKTEGEREGWTWRRWFHTAWHTQARLSECIPKRKVIYMMKKTSLSNSRLNSMKLNLWLGYKSSPLGIVIYWSITWNISWIYIESGIP